MSGYELRWAAKSDIGLLRTGNEDSAYAGSRLLVVADGMGGHAAGEIASAAVVARFAELDQLDLTPAEALAALSATADEANQTVAELITANGDRAGMGTTLTALAWLADRIALVHVGDSRAYLFRDGELQQLTHDHTYVQTLVDAGRITADEATTHPRRNLLMRAIDGSAPVEPDLSIREARLGDRYLLCSDGLSGVLSESDIATVLMLGDPTGAVTALVERAIVGGAPDNVTCVVADVVESNSAPGASDGVVVGAAAESRIRDQLPGIWFPADVEPAMTPAGGPPSKDPKRHWLRGQPWRIAVLLVGGAGLGAVLALGGVTIWTQSQFYVGVHNGYVTIFRGIPQGIVGLSFSTVLSQTDLLAASLPDYDQRQLVETFPAKSLEAARRTVVQLRIDATAVG